MDSFFIYRLPDQIAVNGGAGKVRLGLHPGFVLSSFYGDENALLSISADKEFTISDLRLFQESLIKDDVIAEGISKSALYPFHRNSISREDHIKNVSHIVTALGEGEKTVCCAPVCGDDILDLADSFLNLCAAFPSAFVFCFFTPQSGIWIGASPELLLKRVGNQFQTMALAGTRMAYSPDRWDEKNLEEQRMVSQYIETILNSFNLSYHSDPTPLTRKAGPIEHLCTFFSIEAPKIADKEWLSDFLSELAPTPALCGLPKEKAYRLINQTENFSRGYYGGFIGPYLPDGDFSLFVLLRAVRVDNKGWCMFAGGGITPSSDPEKEWVETRRKAISILDKISYVAVKN